MMSMSLYMDMIKTIESHKIRKCQDVLEAKYPTVSTMTLGSVLSNYVQRKMKANHSKHNTPEMIEGYYKRFMDAVGKGEESGIILRISDEIGITPVLVARFILEAYLRHLQVELSQCNTVEAENQEAVGDQQETLHSSDDNIAHNLSNKNKLEYNFTNIRAEVTRLLRNTSLIEDKNVAYEVYLCLVHDDHYGPCPDVIKRTVGAEYETILMKKLEELGISYLDEAVLRKQGYDKTPDFKLDIPIAIEGRVVNWIESKATFGDEATHQTYLDEQLTSYFNRFGPGLVIYWLGYVETLESRTTKGIFVRDHLPTACKINKMNPSLIPVKNQPHSTTTVSHSTTKEASPSPFD